MCNDEAYILATKQVLFCAGNQFLLKKMSRVRTVRQPDTLSMPVPVAATRILAREHDLLVHVV